MTSSTTFKAAGPNKECAWPEIGNTALLSAIAAGREDMVRLLVEELGADVNLSSPRIMRLANKSIVLKSLVDKMNWNAIAEKFHQQDKTFRGRDTERPPPEKIIYLDETQKSSSLVKVSTMRPRSCIVLILTLLNSLK